MDMLMAGLSAGLSGFAIGMMVAALISHSANRSLKKISTFHMEVERGLIREIESKDSEIRKLRMVVGSVSDR